MALNDDQKLFERVRDAFAEGKRKSVAETKRAKAARARLEAEIENLLDVVRAEGITDEREQMVYVTSMLAMRRRGSQGYRASFNFD